MALKINLDKSAVGVPFGAAYAMITTFNGNKHGVDYHVVVYANQDARINGALQVGSFAYRYEGNLNDEIMKLLYADLKTRPEFENAEDC